MVRGDAEGPRPASAFPAEQLFDYIAAPPPAASPGEQLFAYIAGLLPVYPKWYSRLCFHWVFAGNDAFSSPLFAITNSS